jgi:hypothetical protein
MAEKAEAIAAKQSDARHLELKGTRTAHQLEGGDLQQVSCWTPNTLKENLSSCTFSNATTALMLSAVEGGLD